MIEETGRSQIQSNLAGTTIDYHVNQQNLAHITNLLRNAYSDPALAVVREYVCNAIDAHVQNGNIDIPIEVYFPTEFDPTFKVRDFGPGLPDEDMHLLFGYGSSGEYKRESNAYIGAKGIGCKSGFALGIDTFIYTVWHGGRKKVWQCYLDETDVGKAMLVSDTASEAPTGVEISIPVPDNFQRQVTEKASGLFPFMSAPIKICRPTGLETSFEKIPDPAIKIMLSNGASVSVYPNIDTHRLFSSQNYLGIWTMGGVPYTIGRSRAYEIRDAAWVNRDKDRRNALPHCLFDIPIGAVQLAPSREEFQWSKKTTAFVEACVQELYERVDEEVLQQLGLPDPLTSYPEFIVAVETRALLGLGIPVIARQVKPVPGVTEGNLNTLEEAAPKSSESKAMWETHLNKGNIYWVKPRPETTSAYNICSTDSQVGAFVAMPCANNRYNRAQTTGDSIPSFLLRGFHCDSLAYRSRQYPKEADFEATDKLFNPAEPKILEGKPGVPISCWAGMAEHSDQATFVSNTGSRLTAKRAGEVEKAYNLLANPRIFVLTEKPTARIFGFMDAMRRDPAMPAFWDWCILAPNMKLAKAYMDTFSGLGPVKLVDADKVMQTLKRIEPNRYKEPAKAGSGAAHKAVYVQTRKPSGTIRKVGERIYAKDVNRFTFYYDSYKLENRKNFEDTDTRESMGIITGSKEPVNHRLWLPVDAYGVSEVPETAWLKDLTPDLCRYSYDDVGVKLKRMYPLAVYIDALKWISENATKPLELNEAGQPFTIYLVKEAYLNKHKGEFPSIQDQFMDVLKLAQKNYRRFLNDQAWWICARQMVGADKLRNYELVTNWIPELKNTATYKLNKKLETASEIESPPRFVVQALAESVIARSEVLFEYSKKILDPFRWTSEAPLWTALISPALPKAGYSRFSNQYLEDAVPLIGLQKDELEDKTEDELNSMKGLSLLTEQLTSEILNTIPKKKQEILTNKGNK